MLKLNKGDRKLKYGGLNILFQWMEHFPAELNFIELLEICTSIDTQSQSLRWKLRK